MSLQTNPGEPAVSTKPSAATARSRSRVRYNESMRLVHRAHLYAGLFMTPWVFLYGITALLFNHPGAFPNLTQRQFQADELSGMGFGKLPRPDALAAAVVESMNKSDATGSAYRLVRPGEAAFSRELSATARGGDHSYTVRLDLDSGEGAVREAVVRPKAQPAPFAASGGTSPAAPLAGIEAALPAALKRLGISADEVSVRTNPAIDFVVKGRDREWRVQYDLVTGDLSGRPADESGGSLSTRRFLTRLHLAHGYPARFGARWGWAVAVDLMFASMVGWGFTGLLMWWQMKNVRRVGAVVLAASAVVATVLAVGMHESITAASSAAGPEAPGTAKSGTRKGTPKSPTSQKRGQLPSP